VENREDVKKQAAFLPAVNKLGKEGYDGRGVQILRTAEDLDKAFDAPGLLEKLVDFDKEVAVIVARNARGEVKAFPPVRDGISPRANLVEYLFAPAALTPAVATKVDDIAPGDRRAGSMVGLLAVEMFVTKTGEVLVNEVAPRPHNSGHQTIEANVTSQYEQHLRAILDLPSATRADISQCHGEPAGRTGYTGPARYEGFAEVTELTGVHVTSLWQARSPNRSARWATSPL